MVHALYIIGFSHAAYLMILLGTKRKKHTGDLLLTAFFLISGLFLYLIYARTTGFLHTQMPHLLRVKLLLPAFLPPLFFLYIASLTQPSFRLKRVHGLYFLPALAIIVMLFPYFLLSAEEKTFISVNEYLPRAYVGAYFLQRLSTLGFALASLWYLRLHQKRISAYFSEKSSVALLWLKILAWGFLFYALWMAFAYLMNFFLYDGINRSYFAEPSLTLLVLVLGFFGLRQDRIYPSHDPERNQLVETMPTVSEKYEKSGLAPDKASDLAHQLKVYMVEEKAYLNPKLSLSDLAEVLGVSMHHLSQVINEQEGQHFFEFVNRYRVEAVKKALKDPANHHLTILSLALDAGFNSKAAFNATFKKLTGQTPSAYRKAPS
ncbi:MAG: helix-turn-helix transcriptional regulator [Bacteroidota bacterium]